MTGEQCGAVAARLHLRPLSLDDGREIYDMLQQIASNDNGFHNPVCGMSVGEYGEWLRREYGYDTGDLEDWMVPQSSYWLYDGDQPVGYGRLRHRLNAALEAHSGHIGYAIAQPYRGRGYGNAILALLLNEAARLGLKWVQIGANADNARSNRVIRHCGGELIRTDGSKNLYRITLKRGAQA